MASLGLDELTHFPMCCIYASVNWVIIGSGNGVSPVRRQAITWTQCWLIVNWTPGKKFQWNLNQNSTIFFQENSFEDVVCRMAAICPRGDELTDMSQGARECAATVLTLLFQNILATVWKGQKVNTLRLIQDGHHFPDDIFKCFLNENVWIMIKISLKFVPKAPINNILTLVQVVAWCWPGDKPLSEPMLVSLLMHICGTLPQWVNSLSLSEARWQRLGSCIYLYFKCVIFICIWSQECICNGLLYLVYLKTVFPIQCLICHDFADIALKGLIIDACWVLIVLQGTLSQLDAQLFLTQLDLTGYKIDCMHLYIAGLQWLTLWLQSRNIFFVCSLRVNRYYL